MLWLKTGKPIPFSASFKSSGTDAELLNELLDFLLDEKLLIEDAELANV
jgi:hypothetical protein